MVGLMHLYPCSWYCTAAVVHPNCTYTWEKRGKLFFIDWYPVLFTAFKPLCGCRIKAEATVNGSIRQKELSSSRILFLSIRGKCCSPPKLGSKRKENIFFTVCYNKHVTMIHTSYSGKNCDFNRRSVIAWSYESIHSLFWEARLWAYFTVCLVDYKKTLQEKLLSVLYKLVRGKTRQASYRRNASCQFVHIWPTSKINLRFDSRHTL